MDAKRARIEELTAKLNAARDAYYLTGEEIMPNIEYDALYDELEALEKETGIVLDNSPTQNVGPEAPSELPKETHPSPMLSLDKTKDRQALADWLGDHEGVLSWKLDGLTIVVTYDGGTLTKAVTRGNGIRGVIVTNNARNFDNLPKEIPFKGHLVMRGEAVIKYSDFEKINEEIPEEGAKYKNPRNLCSGSVTQLDPRVTKQRHVNLIAFTLVEAEEDGVPVDFGNRFSRQMDWLREQGFDSVPYKKVTRETTLDTIEWYAHIIAEDPENGGKPFDIPSDGLVMTYEDVAYGKSLGATAKFPRGSIAFKWADQKEETTLREIEWSPSRTGLINPVAIFDPVELEGTTVSRASVHNVSIMEELGLAVGDRITVYKANMIIPQIAEDLTPGGSVEIPDTCPVCGGRAEIRDVAGVRTLYCVNPACPAKQIKGFALFASRDALNIDGLSEATLEKLVDIGAVKEPADLFRLTDYEDEIQGMEGFGEKSYQNLIASAERARHTTPERLLYGLGIPGIGSANAKLICRAFHNKWTDIQAADEDQLLKIDGVGGVLANAYVSYFSDPKKQEIVKNILDKIDLDETEEERDDFLEGKTFVITGALHGYANRDELKARIEQAGGKVSGSVSKKTAYLVNNDLSSQTGKNKKAKELGIPIIDEDTVTSWLDAGAIGQ